MKSFKHIFFALITTTVLAVGFLLIPACTSDQDSDLMQLSAEFADPPDEARPFTWWHWIHGNITKEGITKDLEWMKEFGLGGAIVFNVGRFSDEVPRPVPFQSEEWWAMVDHAIVEADRLGLKLGFHNCDGWSHSGGPWMEEDESMKKMVWTETLVSAGNDGIELRKPESVRDYYKDIAVLAMPVKEGSEEIKVKNWSSNMPGLDVGSLLDGDMESTLLLRNIRPEEPLIFDFELEKKSELASISLTTAAQRIRHIVMEMEISEDGINYQSVREFTSRARGTLGWKTAGAGSTFTFNFPVQEARYFRLKFEQSGDFDLAEVILSGSEKVDLWEAKAGQVQYTEHGGGAEFFFPDPDRIAENPLSKSEISESVIDLSERLKDDGQLDWTPPDGLWRVIRVGQTTTGKTNSPSTLEGRGLEADKLDPAALSKHYSNFMKLLVEREVNENTSSLAYTEIDSWEAGPQNWTNGLLDIFQELNGYDMKPFLPVLAGGYVVGNYELSERFLWDFRKTLAHLIREGCFRHLAELAAEDGLLPFSEGSGRQQYLYDPINFQSTAPIPKGEFWIGPDQGSLLPDGSPLMAMRPRIDCKVASSVAHIYGGQLAGSESFTGGQPAWFFGPGENKMLGDQAYAMGVNWIVLHTSVHQPYDHLKPGFSLGAAGSHFHRNNIIYSQSNGWVKYMTRCQHMLRQGLFVADVLCFTGEDVPNYLGFRHELSVPLPEGYDYDGCNKEILEQAMVKDGKIVLESGMEYHVLLLPDRPYMSLNLLSTIEKMISQGATVVGPAPAYAPGLQNYPDQNAAVAELAGKIWGDCDGIYVMEQAYGKGRVIWGPSFREIFDEMDLKPDFTGGKQAFQGGIKYIHRRMGALEIYFIANADPEGQQMKANFRTEDKVPYLFDPGTGQVRQLAVFTQHEQTMEVPIRLDPYGSAFIIFAPGDAGSGIQSVKGPGHARLSLDEDGNILAEYFESGKYQIITKDEEVKEKEIKLPDDHIVEGEWNLTFPANDHQGQKKLVTELIPWNEFEDPEIRYFSGTVVYEKEWDMPEDFLTGDQSIYLDLGRVEKIARVTLNGNVLPEFWKIPFSAEITAFVREGKNQMAVEVTNTWANRMIGDEDYPQDLSFPSFHRNLTEMPEWLDGSKPRPTDRRTFTITKFFYKGDELQESGLLGPVVLKASKTIIL